MYILGTCLKIIFFLKALLCFYLPKKAILRVNWNVETLQGVWISKTSKNFIFLELGLKEGSSQKERSWRNTVGLEMM